MKREKLKRWSITDGQGNEITPMLDLVPLQKKQYFLVGVVPALNGRHHIKVRPIDAENNWMDRVLYPEALNLKVSFK